MENPFKKKQENEKNGIIFFSLYSLARRNVYIPKWIFYQECCIQFYSIETFFFAEWLKNLVPISISSHSQMDQMKMT